MPITFSTLAEFEAFARSYVAGGKVSLKGLKAAVKKAEKSTGEKRKPGRPAAKSTAGATKKTAAKKAVAKKPLAKKAAVKAAKPAAKKVVAKKASMKTVKPVAKKATVKSAKPAAKKVVAKAVKPVAKKAAMKSAKPAAKKATLKTAKPAAKKTVANKPMAKKAVAKPAKPAVKKALVKTATAKVAKPSVKKVVAASGEKRGKGRPKAEGSLTAKIHDTIKKFVGAKREFTANDIYADLSSREKGVNKQSVITSVLKQMNTEFKMVNVAEKAGNGPRPVKVYKP